MKPNLNAIDEYYKKESEYLARVAELDEITAQRDSARAEYDVPYKCVSVFTLLCTDSPHHSAFASCDWTLSWKDSISSH